jgi:hypothetical protein
VSSFFAASNIAAAALVRLGWLGNPSEFRADFSDIGVRAGHLSFLDVDGDFIRAAM